MENYNLIGRIGEGAHGIVLKSRDLVALKKVPLRKLEDGISHTALREIKALQTIEFNPFIVRLREVFPHGTGFVLVFDYMLTDLSEIIRNADLPLNEGIVKSYMLMLIQGVAFMHKHNIMHRDLKPANLLISPEGILKIADFGLARVFQNNQERLYSHQVATRWYRAPELLYGARKYTESVDVWAVGCIFGELLNCSPIFPGENDIEQLWFVIRVLGTPNEKNWPDLVNLPDYNKITFSNCKPVSFNTLLPDASDEAINLLKEFLKYPPDQRLSMNEALLNNYFITGILPAHYSELPKPIRHRSNYMHPQYLYEYCLDPHKKLPHLEEDFLTNACKFANFEDIF